eukprot:10298186-Heterocapsa_arctica.AAC.1
MMQQSCTGNQCQTCCGKVRGELGVQGEVDVERAVWDGVGSRRGAQGPTSKDLVAHTDCINIEQHISQRDCKTH